MILNIVGATKSTIPPLLHVTLLVVSNDSIYVPPGKGGLKLVAPLKYKTPLSAKIHAPGC